MTKMEETYFKDPNPLHVLLLVLVKCGLATTYDLKSEAGISVGLTATALRRLEKAGLLISAPGSRKSVRYAVTEKGEDELRTQIESGRMRHWWLEDSSIYKSIPRALFLAWLYADTKQMSDCADLALQELQTLARNKKQEAHRLREAMLRSEASCRRDGRKDREGSLIATVYQWLKAESDAALFTVQIEAMKTMRPLLANLPSAPWQ